MLAVIMTIKKESDREKAAEIFDKYYSTMVYVAKGILTDKALAEDAASEAMIKIIHNLDKIVDVSCHKTRGYVVIMVRNTALNLLKKRTNYKEDTDEALEDVPDGDISILNKLTNDENCEIIINAILSLPEKLADVLYLSAVYGYGNKEISKLLDISYDVIRKRLSRAKKAARELLSEAGDNGGKYE